MNEQGEPLKPNERIVTRDQVDQAYWGINLDKIQDETIVKKGDETLYITADGRIIIKKVVPGYAGETGKAYPSTEQMLTDEQRWDELREYYRKIDAKRTPALDTAIAQPRIDLGFSPGDITRGTTTALRLATERVVSPVPYKFSISAAYDPAVIELVNIAPRRGCTLLQHNVRTDSANRAILHLELTCPANPNGSFQQAARVVFKAKSRGSAELEPLSVGNDPAHDRTYFQLEHSTLKPEVATVVVHVR